MKELVDEDHVVAELAHFGITYISNRIPQLYNPHRTPPQILACCVQQPSSRVRTATISLLLLHPEFSRVLAESLSLLSEEERQLLIIFYTSAVYLQRLYKDQLPPIMTSEWEWLPDYYRADLGLLPGTSPREAIQQLGQRHQQLTHSATNWAGTYENAALHLIRYKQHELQWNQLLPKPSQPS